MTQHKPAWLQATVDYLPLAAFFGAYLAYGLMTATAVLLAATAVTLVVSLAVVRRVPMMPLVTAGIVGVFGGLTLWLNDETFIKMKPTVIQSLFALVLIGGVLMRRNPLKPIFGHVWKLDDAGWRILTTRFAIFFATMAALNEVVWRTQSTEFWVNFKVFGILVLTLAFTMGQVALINRHTISDPAESGPDVRT